jgi:hypothetical protein
MQFSTEQFTKVLSESEEPSVQDWELIASPDELQILRRLSPSTTNQGLYEYVCFGTISGMTHRKSFAGKLDS